MKWETILCGSIDFQRINCVLQTLPFTWVQNVEIVIELLMIKSLEKWKKANLRVKHTWRVAPELNWCFNMASMRLAPELHLNNRWHSCTKTAMSNALILILCGHHLDLLVGRKWKNQKMIWKSPMANMTKIPTQLAPNRLQLHSLPVPSPSLQPTSD